jgi:hypothetical protein
MRFLLIVALTSLMGTASWADDTDQPINFDKQKFLSDWQSMQHDLDQSPSAGIFKKHRYCVICNSGPHLNCDVPVGGEVGRAMCGSYGASQCGGNHVNYNGC